MIAPSKPGRAADPEPIIIELLRLALRHPDKQSVEALAATLELHQILDEWIAGESVTRLRDALGVAAAPRGARRTQRAVSQENLLVQSLIVHAMSGQDVSTFQLAADALGCTEKQIERAWKQWGPQRTHWIRQRVAHERAASFDPLADEQAAATIKRLPSPDTK